MNGIRVKPRLSNATVLLNPYALHDSCVRASALVVSRSKLVGTGHTMNLRRVLLFFSILGAFPLAAREKSDVIVMKNGDKITCEIKGLSSNTLYISVDYILNTLSVDWTKVDHIDSKQLFLVKTEDGTVYTGTLSTPKNPAGRPLQLDVVEGPDTMVTLDRKQIVTVNETSNSFRQRWNGQVGLGFSYTKGNESAQYNLNSDIGYVEERWSAEANYNSNLTSSTGAAVSTRNELTLDAQRLLRWNNWYCTGLADFLQSSVQGIRLQNTFGGGVGKNLLNSGSTFFTVYGGFGWQRINYQQAVLPAQTQQVAVGLLGTELKLFRFDRTTLTVNARLLPAISQPGRLQFNLNTSYYVKLWGKLNWNFTVYGNWDNRPPPGFASSDYGTSSGLSISFGNPLVQ
jgi:putative salt-induced outer membrane protein YdiY